MATQKAKELAKDAVGSPLTPNFSAKDYSIFFAAGALCGYRASLNSLGER
jgi:solute carrier family 25 phosphate transporter 3